MRTIAAIHIRRASTPVTASQPARGNNGSAAAPAVSSDHPQTSGQAFVILRSVRCATPELPARRRAASCARRWTTSRGGPHAHRMSIPCPRDASPQHCQPGGDPRFPAGPSPVASLASGAEGGRIPRRPPAAEIRNTARNAPRSAVPAAITRESSRPGHPACPPERGGPALSPSRMGPRSRQSAGPTAATLSASAAALTSAYGRASAPPPHARSGAVSSAPTATAAEPLTTPAARVPRRRSPRPAERSAAAPERRQRSRAGAPQSGARSAQHRRAGGHRDAPPATPRRARASSACRRGFRATAHRPGRSTASTKTCRPCAPDPARGRPGGTSPVLAGTPTSRRSRAPASDVVSPRQRRSVGASRTHAAGTSRGRGCAAGEEERHPQSGSRRDVRRDAGPRQAMARPRVSRWSGRCPSEPAVVTGSARRRCGAPGRLARVVEVDACATNDQPAISRGRRARRADACEPSSEPALASVSAGVCSAGPAAARAADSTMSPRDAERAARRRSPDPLAVVQPVDRLVERGSRRGLDHGSAAPALALAEPSAGRGDVRPMSGCARDGRTPIVPARHG